MNKFVACLSLFLSGCGFIQFGQDLTIEQQANLISSLSSSSTLVALNEGVKENKERVYIATVLVNSMNSIEKALNGQAPFSATDDFFMHYVPVEYRVFVNSAVTVLFTYVKVDLSQGLSSDQVILVASFINGVRQACNTIIAVNQ